MKPRLAEGSRWEDGCVCNAFGEAVCIDENRNVAINVYHRVGVADALAVIRSAGLDAVWDAAVRLAKANERYDATDGDEDSILDRFECVDALCIAVEAASEKE